MKKITLPILLALFLLIPLSAQASTYILGQEYTLNKTERIEGNTYIGGGMVVVSGTVNGDLMIGGGNITMDGNITKDLTIGGGNIQVLGPVGEDLRIGGGNILIGKDINGDVLVGGGFVNVLPGVKINGDVTVGGGRLILNGEIKGNVTVGGGEVDINDHVLGNVTIYTAEKLRMSKSAVIDGNLDYKSRQVAELVPANVKGKITFKQIAEPKILEKGEAKGILGAVLGGLLLLKLLGALVISVLLTLLFPKVLRRILQKTHEEFPAGVGIGFAILILVPISIIIILITVIGFEVSVILGLLFALFIAFAKIASGIFVGSLFYKWVGWHKTMEVVWHSTIVGVILLHILGIIPILGWFAVFIIFLSLFGSMARLAYKGAQQIR
ncbi:MAG: polymer-forming cytoskeletal protein [Candidatus Gracilibacteria bacterium]